MIDELVSLATQIKDARQRMGMSQRAFAARVGIGQPHLSLIERAEVDLQTTSLIQLAKAADLELVLVPRRALPAVEALSQQVGQRSTELGLSELRLQANRMVRKFPNVPLLERLAQTLTEFPETALPNLPARELTEVLADLDRTRRILQAISLEPESQDLGPAFITNVDTLETALRVTRNRIMHGAAAAPATSTPAYTLDDDETEVS